MITIWKQNGTHLLTSVQAIGDQILKVLALGGIDSPLQLLATQPEQMLVGQRRIRDTNRVNETRINIVDAAIKKYFCRRSG